VAWPRSEEEARPWAKEVYWQGLRRRGLQQWREEVRRGGEEVRRLP